MAIDDGGGGGGTGPATGGTDLGSGSGLASLGNLARLRPAELAWLDYSPRARHRRRGSMAR